MGICLSRANLPSSYLLIRLFSSPNAHPHPLTRLPFFTHSQKRVITRTNSYYYGPIEDTPFSLAISLPEPYGHYRVDGQIEVKRRDENYTHYFKGKNWRVHPDWVYCDNPSNTVSGIPFQSPEEAIRVFLEQAMKSAANVRWRTSSIRPHVYEQLSCESSSSGPRRVFSTRRRPSPSRLLHATRILPVAHRAASQLPFLISIFIFSDSPAAAAFTRYETSSSSPFTLNIIERTLKRTQVESLV